MSSNSTVPPWGQERTYHTPEGERLNIAAAARLLGIKPDTLWQRHTRGNHTPERLLSPRPMTFVNSRGATLEETTFLESELLALKNQRRERKGWFNTPQGQRLDRVAAARFLSVHPATIDNLEEAGRLSVVRMRRLPTYFPLKTYALSDLQEIKRERKAAPAERWERPDGVYIPARVARRLLGVTQQTLTKWRARCPYLPDGEVLRCEPRPVLTGGPETWYPEDQINRIRQARCRRGSGRYTFPDGDYLSKAEIRRQPDLGLDPKTIRRLVDAGLVREEMAPNTLGRGHQTTVYREADLLSYVRRRRVKFNGIYETPEGKRFNLTAAAKRSGLSRTFLKKQLRKSLYLPEGRLPSRPMDPPAERGRSQQEHAILEADLLRLRRSIHDALKQRKPIGWLTASEIVAKYGAVDKERVIGIGASLKEWREAGLLSAVHVWRTRKHGRRRVWYYNPDDVARCLTRLDAGEQSSEMAAMDKRTHDLQKPARTERLKPARAKHERWKMWREDGATYGEIVQRHRDEEGEEVTREAVIHALRRLNQEK
jgi:hypothetical protein